jgi:hypothetical protein
MQKSFWLLISIVLFSCGKDLIVPELGFDYYPIEIGCYRVYDVEETTYLNFVATTETYQLRESFIEEIVNAAESSYLLLIEKRSTPLDQWGTHATVYIRQTNHILEYRENNAPRIAMSYPVKIGRTWFGNTVTKEIESIHRYDKGANDSFDVDQIEVVNAPRDSDNFVEKNQRFEIYGRGIGLIERTYYQIEYCQNFCPGAKEPENGFVVLQQLIEYGSL